MRLYGPRQRQVGFHKNATQERGQYQRDKDSGLRQTANVNLYHLTKFSPNLPFTVYYLYTKISGFTPVLSIRIVLDSFYLLIFYSEKFSTLICRLP